MKQAFQFITHSKKNIFLCLCSLIFLNIQAQNQDKLLTITVKNGTLKEFVKQIENITSYSFIYGEEVKTIHKINLNAKQVPLRDILNKAFWHQPINYHFKGQYIILQHKIKTEANTKTFTISGHISDNTSSETLIGANVTENIQHLGTATNAYGYYTITLPKGKTDLHFSYLGYATKQCSFILHRDTIMNIKMQESNQLQEVVITSKKAEDGLVATQMGANEIPMAQIKSTPNMLGESDIMKTIQLMPGVQSGVDGSAGLIIRGGAPDQNLILLDGIPLYNVDHLFGFFSIFPPESIKKVTLFKSSFPARFGGRLSSVVDIRTNDGDMNHYHGILSIGLLTSKINIQGPIVKNKTAFNFSARRSYFDILAKPFMTGDDKFSYYFYDINAKINHKFSDRSRLFINAYNGKDHFYNSYNDHDDTNEKYQNKNNMDWGNTIFSGRWNYIFNNQLFSNTTIAYNNYLSDIKISTNTTDDKKNIINTYDSKYHSGIRDWSYQIDFNYNPTPNHDIRFGTEYLYHEFRPEVVSSKIANAINGTIEQDTTYHNISNSKIYANEVSLYAEDNLKIGSKFNMNVGLHFSMFYVHNKTYLSPQPRLSARYQLSQNIALKASYTKMSQYVHLLSYTPIAMPIDLWVPVTDKIKPMRSHQYSFGAYYSGVRNWEFSMETYYKNMKNVLEYKDGVSYFGKSAGWEDKVDMGIGRTIGIEFMAKKSIGKTTGWVSYTLAKSERKFGKESINYGKWFPYKYDRRHNVNITLTHKFSKSIDLGASWVCYSGGTTTIPEKQTTIIQMSGIGESTGHYIDDAPYVGHRNNYRLPWTHRLNLSANFNKKTKYGMRTWNVSLFNVYNAMNPTFVYYSTKDDHDNKTIPSIKKFTLLPFIPSVTYLYKF